MQASLGNVIKGEGDNEDVHFEDTLARAADTSRETFVHTAPKAVRELAAWGLPWSRVQKGRSRGHYQRAEGDDHQAR